MRIKHPSPGEIYVRYRQNEKPCPRSARPGQWDTAIRVKARVSALTNTLQTQTVVSLEPIPRLEDSAGCVRT